MDPNIEMNFEEEYSFRDHFLSIKRTMIKVGQATSNNICVPSPEDRILRAKLVFEEAMEMVHDLGVDYCLGKFYDAGEKHYNPKGVLDAAADIAVVTNGTLLACGLWTKFPEALERVDENNWSKVRNGVIKNSDGKYQKPTDYVPVVLDDLIEGMK